MTASPGGPFLAEREALAARLEPREAHEDKDWACKLLPEPAYLREEMVPRARFLEAKLGPSCEQFAACPNFRHSRMSSKLS